MNRAGRSACLRQKSLALARRRATTRTSSRSENPGDRRKQLGRDRAGADQRKDPGVRPRQVPGRDHPGQRGAEPVQPGLVQQPDRRAGRIVEHDQHVVRAETVVPGDIADQPDARDVLGYQGRALGLVTRGLADPRATEQGRRLGQTEYVPGAQIAERPLDDLEPGRHIEHRLEVGFLEHPQFRHRCRPFLRVLCWTGVIRFASIPGKRAGERRSERPSRHGRRVPRRMEKARFPDRAGDDLLLPLCRDMGHLQPGARPQPVHLCRRGARDLRASAGPNDPGPGVRCRLPARGDVRHLPVQRPLFVLRRKRRLRYRRFRHGRRLDHDPRCHRRRTARARHGDGDHLGRIPVVPLFRRVGPLAVRPQRVRPAPDSDRPLRPDRRAVRLDHLCSGLEPVPVPGVRDFPDPLRRVGLFHRSLPVFPRHPPRRRGEGRGGVVLHHRQHLGLGLGQCRDHRQHHHSDNGEDRLSAGGGRRHRGPRPRPAGRSCRP